MGWPTAHEKTSHRTALTRSLPWRPSNGVGWAPIGSTQMRFLWNALEMVVLPPQGASDTYGQLPDIGADTMRAPRYGFTLRSYFL